MATTNIELRMEIYKLRLVKAFSKSAGYLIWTIVSIFLGFLFFTFVGLVIGFWMSHLTGSFTQGFGIATLIMMGIIILLAIFRKVLFVNPIIRAVIRRTHEEDPGDDNFNAR